MISPIFGFVIIPSIQEIRVKSLKKVFIYDNLKLTSKFELLVSQFLRLILFSFLLKCDCYIRQILKIVNWIDSK